MKPETLTIEYLELGDGTKPYLEWFRDQPAEVKALVAVRLEKVLQRNFGDHRRLKGGVIELRWKKHGKGLRIYGGELDGRFFILVTGGFKKGQQADVDFAVTEWKAYTKTRANKKR